MPEKPVISLIYQKPEYLVILKPAGVLVHEVKISGKSQREREFTVTDWLLNSFPEVAKIGDDPMRPGIVHRLDKDTSGVMVVPRTQAFFEYLKDLFQKGKVKKTYLTLVWGAPKEKRGVINKTIYLKPGSTKRSVFSGKMAKAAITEYEVLGKWRIPEKKGKFSEFSLLKVMPKTGRTHQIRVHLASIGHPVVGDPLYGKRKNSFGLNRQFLHADSLEFPVASGEAVRISADLPPELQAIIDEFTRKV